MRDGKASEPVVTDHSVDVDEMVTHQAESAPDGIHTMYVWHAYEKGSETEGFIRAWTSDPARVPGLQAIIGEPPVIYRAAQSGHRADVAEEAIAYAAHCIAQEYLRNPTQSDRDGIAWHIRCMFLAPPAPTQQAGGKN